MIKKHDQKDEVAHLTHLSASELAHSIAEGHLSSEEVVEAHIRQIETVNPLLNAVVVPLFAQARAEARKADSMLAQGTSVGPLHGVPITLKEQFMVSGTPTTVGIMSQRSRPMEHEGPLVQRLRQAGAIVLGKTNVSQLLMYHESDNPVYGRTNNPWDLARTPGGSSGGEAAIIAAGGSPLGLGGDFGGSIRVPAHFCGLYSLLPTARRLTHLDTAHHAYVAGQEAIIAQPAPIARSVEDLRLAMNILAAPGLNALDPSVPPVPWPDPTAVSLRGLRIGMYTNNGVFSVAPSVRRAVEEAAQVLRARGAIVESWNPPDVAEAIQIYVGLVGADGFATHKRNLGRDTRDRRISFNMRVSSLPGIVRAPLVGLLKRRGQVHMASSLQHIRGRLSVEQYWHLVGERNQYRQHFLTALDAEHFDALLCPPHALPALTHGSSGTLNVTNAGSYAILYNLLGLPAGVAPITRVRPGEESERSIGKDSVERAARTVEMGSAGLPVGVQLVARPWREDIVLALMAALEEHTGASVPVSEGS
ncbi:amidase [Ktedonobacter racemifer]|uniref:Amidase n=1 Tax=Ktedonobacter racemifer DSM 44963 TaxID=485913 RepID=D6U4X0_KTERA|nr:amidase [Ktedonobacter racemifer]EFH81550.1 Amidase [Ktedonobacter racemifer DSM 44963]